jgi:hypothetical protein
MRQIVLKISWNQIYLPSCYLFFLQRNRIIISSANRISQQYAWYHTGFTKQPVLNIEGVTAYHPSNSNMLLLSAKYKRKMMLIVVNGKGKARDYITTILKKDFHKHNKEIWPDSNFSLRKGYQIRIHFRTSNALFWAVKRSLPMLELRIKVSVSVKEFYFTAIQNKQ